MPMSVFPNDSSENVGFSVPRFRSEPQANQATNQKSLGFSNLWWTSAGSRGLWFTAKWTKSGPRKSAPSWHQFISELDWLIHDCDYLKLTAPLVGIRDTVLATRRVTAGQQHAVERIRAIVLEGGA
jgi:hypothetical protein